MRGEFEACPACGNEVTVIRHERYYSVHCSCCKYNYGVFTSRQCMARAWNVLVEVFPSSIRMMARSVQTCKRMEV